MIDQVDSPLVVRFPTPLNARMRIGPFPSLAGALKFLGYCAVGAAVALSIGALFWLPFVGAGLLFSVYPGEDKGLDERAIDLLRYRWRTASSEPATDRAELGEGGSVLMVPPGLRVAIVSTRGLPVAFRPPRDARRLFEEFQVVLRAGSPRLFIWMTVEPVPTGDYLADGSISTGPSERRAVAGYVEMIQRLVRQRFRRVVYIALWEPAFDLAGSSRLTARLTAVSTSLGLLGLEPARVHGNALLRLARRLGWRTD